ncbi:abhydrolase domain-containing protein (secreted protein) [Marssonina coronariae]|uniref:Abhydrolase domain-containing protein (Secreted protein) n=1 Tax=Diplocarpon coronariae TaxID=2795749 RepID=A0A218YXJ3_9HELO|nr:abhydrolase domain-containing protein (secreted protein) [Marssonina coronariae]
MSLPDLLIVKRRIRSHPSTSALLMARPPTPGCAEDITKTEAFQLLKNDPNAYLIINSNTPRTQEQSLKAGAPTPTALSPMVAYPTSISWPSNIGASGFPQEHIVIVGQSLGTAVTSAVVEHFDKQGTDFAGVVLDAGFRSMSNLLTQYSILGFVPILAPFSRHHALQRLLTSFVVDE